MPRTSAGRRSTSGASRRSSGSRSPEIGCSCTTCCNGVDTYLVNEEGTVYRYQAKPIKIVWQEWATAPVDGSATGHAEANANGNGHGNGNGTLEVLAPQDS
jgi:hypothetical protein